MGAEVRGNEMKTFLLKDSKFPPDEFLVYTKELKLKKPPIIIDLGSFQCRVGWASQKEPCLVFRTIMARARREKGKKVETTGEIQVGNEIANIEAVRFQLKSPFDRNIVTQFEAMEQMFDYIFLRLGIDTEGKVDHPIILTEPFLNLNYSRQLMTELLLDTYNVPAVNYGVDCLLSYRQQFCDKSGIILSLGYHTLHIIPMLKGVVDPARSRRINLGGSNIVAFLHRLLQLKYPGHANAITLSRAEEIVHEHTYVATDYFEELQKWIQPEFYDQNVHIIQLAYTAPVVAPTLSADQQKEKKRELQRRLIEINARKRDEKLHKEEETLNQLLDARELLETGQKKSLKRALAKLGLADVTALSRAIVSSQQTISKIREKIQAATLAAEAPEEQKPVVLPVRGKEEVDALIIQLKEEREEILARRAARRQRKRDLAQRRTAAAQERMRLISQLARKDKKEDNFGMRDEDWDVYKAINRDGGSSDSEEEAERLGGLENELRQYDPGFDSENTDTMAPGESHQLHVATERIRAPEVLFQPSLIGSHEAGLAETLEFALKSFSPEKQNLLVSNVFLTGSCASFPGLKKRLERELLEMRPFQSTFKVNVALDCHLAGWNGAKHFSKTRACKRTLLNKETFETLSMEYFMEHKSSNVYYQSPPPLPPQPPPAPPMPPPPIPFIFPKSVKSITKLRLTPKQDPILTPADTTIPSPTDKSMPQPTDITMTTPTPTPTPTPIPTPTPTPVPMSTSTSPVTINEAMEVIQPQN